MKKIIPTIICLGAAVLFGYFSFDIYVYSRLNKVEQNMLERYPDMTDVQSINRIGKWGEWFSDYAAVVEMDGQIYRVWTDDKGNITDKEPL